MRDRFLEVFNYDGVTGLLTWKVRTSNRVTVGAVASCPSGNGYIKVRVDSVLHYAHMVIATMVFGDIPDRFEIDHINGNRSDNRICNIRLVSPQENRRNQGGRKDNRSGATGVIWRTDAHKWAAYIGLGDRIKHLGLFDSFNQACHARKDAEVLYKFHKNHGTKR